MIEFLKVASRFSGYVASETLGAASGLGVVEAIEHPAGPERVVDMESRCLVS